MNMDVSDLVLLAIGVYFAVTSLVRLMRSRRDALVRELTFDAEQQQRRKKQDEKKKKKAERKKAA
jgi:hypothetical protein